MTKRPQMACLAVFMLFVFALPSSGWAKSFRVNQLPNGPRFNCDLCHEPGNTGYVNPFGVQVLSHLKSGDVKWEEMWNLDADGDGYTNGQELGDPDGTWRIGMSHPSSTASHPGYADQNLCGNGNLEELEACDTNDLQGETCSTQGFATGALACGSLCELDVTGCSNCGNGIIEKGDQCDGDEFGDLTCELLGYDGGTLTCGTNCRAILSACEGEPVPKCGDGIRVRGEECEGQDFGQRNCLALGFSGGQLRCSDTCTYDTSTCAGTGPGRERLTAIPTDSVENDDDSSDSSDSTCATQPISPTLFGLLLIGGIFMRRRKDQ